ncbi:MAG: ABC transporter permease [Bacteroidales bacterium]|nr:ABC transporter permease [Bacteroidales bacterium]
MRHRFDIDTFREIADSLFRNRRRTLLTGFGIFWGLFMLLFLVGGGKGLKQSLSQNFEGFATNTMVMVSSNTSVAFKGMKEGRYWSLTTKDVERLQALVPELDVVAPIVSMWAQTAYYKGNSTSPNIKGIAGNYHKIEAPELKYGRTISEADVEQARKVCVLGKRVYNDLFPQGGDPCGAFIQVGTVFLQVVGVDFSSGNLNINGSSSEAILIPYSVAARLYRRGNTVDLICMTGKKGVKMSSLEAKVRSLMAREHLFDPGDNQALVLINTEQIFSIVDNLFRGVNFLIWLVGIGTLLAGAVGVSNIMMVTVRERTVEIGIRRAIGAVPRDILSQIIWESVTLTLTAGSAGIVFSVLLLNMLEIITHHQADYQIGFWTAALAALLLSVLGVLAGLAPALRAMKIKPVDAMRDE